MLSRERAIIKREKCTGGISAAATRGYVLKKAIRSSFAVVICHHFASSCAMEIVHGAASYILRTAEIELAITEQAGHMAPVRFVFASGEHFSPYALSPWLPGELEASLPPLLRYLRGDFLCLPFGGQQAGPPHGDPANARWELREQTAETLSLQQQAGDSGAQLEKNIRLVAGQQAIYVEHRVSGLSGNWNYGNHPVLDFSHLAEGEGRVATSPWRWGSVYPGEFSDPKQGERGALLPGGHFTDLRQVPLRDGGLTDLTRYPLRSGYDDLIMLVNEAATPEQPFAWTAVTMRDKVWFSLKNPADFPATLFWLSNGGRSATPWLDRHTCRLGLEEVCSHFSDGVDVSREDRLADVAVPTSRCFRADESVSLRVIQAAVEVPADFGQVQTICPDGTAAVRLTGEGGAAVRVAIDWPSLQRATAEPMVKA